MPKRSEFEEKEFETKLAPELAFDHVEFWTPGQVLENYTGAEVFATASASVMQATGRSWMFGVWLDDLLVWKYVVQHWAGAGTPPPDFRANLFLQVKRSHLYTRSPTPLGSPCWKMEIDADQQTRLEAVEAALGGRAVVAYAAPAFDSRAALFKHARAKTLTKNTSYPAPSWLKGHHRWQYDSGGATGQAASEPEEIDGPSLTERVERVLEATAEAQDVQAEDQLRVLLGALLDAADDGTREALAGVLDQVGGGVDSAVGALWAQVQVTCEYMGLTWLVLGRPQ